MAFLLAALAAALAVSVELAEACAIVLAVGVSRGWRPALVGASGGALVCAAVALLLGPIGLASLTQNVLRAVIGGLLLALGLEWLRKGTLRLAGLKPRSSASGEFAETERELAAEPAAEDEGLDRGAVLVSFKGVLLEGVEIVLIVGALAARPQGPAPALIGAAVAAVATTAVAITLRRPLARLPETELKWLVGVVLSSFGVFFLTEGLDGGWPGGELALLYIAGTLAFVSYQLGARLQRRPA